MGVRVSITAAAPSASPAMTVTRVMALNQGSRDQAAVALSHVLLPITLVPLVAPPVGGFLTDLLGWRSVFWVSAVTGILAIGLIALFAPRDGARPAVERVSPLQEWQKMLRSRQFHGYNIHHSFVIVSFNVLYSAAPLILISVMGLTASEYGIYSMAPALGALAGAWMGARYTRRYGGDNILLYGGVLAVVCYTLVVIAALVGLESPWHLVAPMVLISFSNVLVLPSSTSGALERFPQSRGLGAGLMSLIQFVFVAIIIQASAPWVVDFPLGLFAVCLGCYLVAIAGFLLGRSR